MPGSSLQYGFSMEELRNSPMKSFASSVLVFFVIVPASIAQDQSSSLTGSSAESSASTSQDQQDSQVPQEEKQKSKEGKKPKKNKRSIDEVTASVTFSDAVAQSLLQQLTDGLEGHSDKRMLSPFDEEKFEGYLSFENQVVAMFQRYDSFRVYFRISQATTEGSKCAVLVDIEMEEIPRSADAQPIRKRDQLRFEMERGKKEWKIVDLKPRSFFS